MRRFPLLLATLVLLAASGAEAATPRLVGVGTGGYAFAGDDVLQALAPARHSHTGALRLIHPDGSAAAIGTVALPPGSVTGVAADASPAGAIAFYGIGNDLSLDLFLASGPLTGPFTPLEAFAPAAFTSGWLLDDSTVLALRKRPGPTAADPQGSLVTLGLDGALLAERPLVAPPNEEAYELRAQGARRAVVFASEDATCRAEAQVLDSGQPAVRVPALRQGSYCVPTWVDWQVQEDGKLAAVEQSRDGRRRLSWFGTDGVRHRVPGLVDPGVPGLGFAGDRLLFARLRSSGHSDLVVRGTDGGERVLAHLDPAAANGVLGDFDGTRALWTTARCGDPMRAYAAADVGTATAARAPAPVVCGVTDIEREVSLSAAGRSATTLACHASRSLRCVGEARLSFRGRLVGVLPILLRGGEARSSSFRLDAAARRAIARARGALWLKEDLRWRDEHHRKRTLVSRLYLDMP